MKDIALIGIIVCLFSCKGEQIQTLVTYDMISSEFTQGEMACINENIEQVTQYMNDKSRTEALDRIDYAIADLANCKLYKLPIYGFDIEKFYEDPSPENIARCIKTTNMVLVLCEKEGEIRQSVTLNKDKNGKYHLDGGTFDYGSVISWLPGALQGAEMRSFKFFYGLYGGQYITFNKGKKTLYYKTTGELLSNEKLCEFFVSNYQQYKEDLEAMERMLINPTDDEGKL